MKRQRKLAIREKLVSRLESAFDARKLELENLIAI